jgi:hypothetical protein
MLTNREIVNWKDPTDTESIDEDQEKPGTVFMNSMDVTPSWLQNELPDIFTKPHNPLEQLFYPPTSSLSPEKLFSGQYDTLTKRRLSEIISHIPPASNTAENKLEYPNNIDFLEDVEQFGENVLRTDSERKSLPPTSILDRTEVSTKIVPVPEKARSMNGVPISSAMQKAVQSSDLSHRKLESLKGIFDEETSITRLKL